MAIFATSSCSKDDTPNFHFVPLRIVSAELPEFFSIDQTYQIRVTYSKPDACTSFGGFDVTPKGVSARNVVVIGTKHYDDEACAQTVVEETGTFNFRVAQTETYLFRFWQSEDADGNQEYFEVFVPVRE